MAIVHALLLATLSAAMAAGASLLAQVELRAADHHRATREAAFLARGAAAIAIHELREMPDWTAVLSGGIEAGFRSEVPPGTDAICCGVMSLTGRLRAATGRAWTAFGWSPAERLLGAGDARLYVVVWVVDDPADADGDPSTDSNHMIAIRAEARRQDGLAVAVEAILERVAAGSGSWEGYDPDTGSIAFAGAHVRVRSWRAQL